MSITKEQVLQMDWKAVQVAVKADETKAEMQTLLRDRAVVSYVSKLMLDAQNHEAELDAKIAVTVPPSTEELAAQATAMVEVVPAEVVQVATPVEQVPTASNFDVEDAEWKAAGIVVVRDGSGKATRYVEEYQVRDEDGTPIGRPTHLESRTLPELAGKKREAHENATRAFHRLKKQKLSFKAEEPKPVLSPTQIQAAVKRALESKNETEATEAVRQILTTEFSEREQQVRNETEAARRLIVSEGFIARHPHDYNDCMANGKIVGEYMSEHHMEFTLDNIEAAVEDLTESDKLAPPVRGVTVPAVVAANPVTPAAVATPAPPAIPAAETPATAPVSAPVTPAQPQAVVTPVVEATAPTPAVPNQHTTARRPGVGGSIAPGSLSAQRPGTPDPTLARKEFLKMVMDMDAPTIKAKLKNDPQFVKQLAVHGIPVK
jgi:hypothetical protein